VNSIIKFGSLPPAEQFDGWRDAVSSAFVPLEATCRADEAFGGELVLQHVGAVQVSQVSGGAVDVQRSPAMIRRADPGFLKLGMQLRGYCLVTQDGREAPLVPGDFALYDTCRPYRLSFDSSFQMLVVMFPRELLNVRQQDLTRLTARRVSGRSGIGGLVSPFLVNLAGKLQAEEVTPTFELSSAVLDMLTAALSAELERDLALSPETHRHALLLRIKAFIDERLDDPDLCTAVVAAAHHISHRYLQKLFEGEGVTVTEWIRHRRLMNCSRELVDPRFESAPISTIAARWGLVDASHFSKMFRNAYGMSPREFRVENAGRG
jgi:AraC-like DNA-binding protein